MTSLAGDLMAFDRAATDAMEAAATEFRLWLDVMGVGYRVAVNDPCFFRIPCPGGRVQVGVHRGPEFWVDVSIVVK